MFQRNEKWNIITVAQKSPGGWIKTSHTGPKYGIFRTREVVHFLQNVNVHVFLKCLVIWFVSALKWMISYIFKLFCCLLFKILIKHYVRFSPNFDPLCGREKNYKPTADWTESSRKSKLSLTWNIKCKFRVIVLSWRFAREHLSEMMNSI